MSKKSNKQPTQSFQDYMASMTLKKFQSYIDEQVKISTQRQKQLLLDALTRIRALEEVLVEKLEGVDRTYLLNTIAEVEDNALQLEKVDVVETGDRVRFQIKTKSVDQTEYQGESNLLLDNVGSGNTLGLEIETNLLGLKTNEIKEFTFGTDGKMTAKVVVNRISRNPKPIKSEASEEALNESVDARQ